MASPFRRQVSWIAIAAPLMALVVSALAPQAVAEHRKFVVILADPPRDHPGQALQLPNRNNVWDAYFDKYKNSTDPDGVRVDSFAEWWEEASYGDVTVSGDVFGWISLPWPTRPLQGFDGDTGFHARGRIQHVDLNNNYRYEPGLGERFSTGIKWLDYDFDGPGYGADPGGQPGAQQADPYGVPVWTPGERFLDTFANGVYDAGVPERWIAIDKNNNGQIDIERKAPSLNALVSGAQINYFPPDDQGEIPEDPVAPNEAIFVGWDLSEPYYEWYDANGDGELGNYGTELWIDINGNNQIGGVAAPEGDNEENPLTLQQFLKKVFHPDNIESGDVEWWDRNVNGRLDYPEPFEDYMRRWNPNSHNLAVVDDEYIANNFPGDATVLQTWDRQNNPAGRTGNKKYDGADSWNNNDTVYNTNKMQEIAYNLVNQAEFDEQRLRQSFETPNPDEGLDPWLSAFWQDYYGNEPPEWRSDIPYLRRFDPTDPQPPIRGDADPLAFEPNAGGPKGDGEGWDNGWGDGNAGTVILPNWANPATGMYDGPAEYHDLPSSIYHQAGDQHFGEINNVSNRISVFGDDVGMGDPAAGSGGALPFPDGIIPAAGPLAYNVHGDGGYDAGNQLNTEYMTWRTDGTGIADLEYDFDGDGVPDSVRWHRDINLDGLIDLGETPGLRTEFGLPAQTVYHNYGVDANEGTPPNGGPDSEYPFNRHRMLEDCIEALDDSVDWDTFLNGPPPFGNLISGVVLFPEGTADGMFSLPASDWSLGIRTRDLQNSQATGRDRFTPISFWDGLAISLSDGQGEGGQFDPEENFHIGFSIHEYCHSWEGYPDLYDYDVYRENFTGRIINTPIGQWCIMAGGLVHPVPPLKVSSGWIDAEDITRVLFPAGLTTIRFYEWEFSRNQTLFQYDNPLYPPESFYFWRVSNDIETFDKNAPGEGLMILHADMVANEEGLPLQQRLGSHFTYQLKEADGLQQLENSENSGDAGDPWPGSTEQTRWNGTTDPSNRWYDGQSSGLEIVDIVETDDYSDVTFFWSPRELPTFFWIQPPGGISVNGIYQLRYDAYDQFGGTQMYFFAHKADPNETSPGYDNGIPLNVDPATKQPGEVRGSFPANVSTTSFEDGEAYTFYAKLVPGIGADGRQERTHSVPRASLDNMGTGQLSVSNVNLAISKLEAWTVTCVDASVPEAETWQVEGSASGIQQNQATTGLTYSTDPDANGNSALSFQITSGPVPYAVGDRFVFLTTGLTPHSAAVLIDDGEVVVPEPPVARAQVEGGVLTGLSPFAVTFRHNQSYDLHDVALTYTWDFGDGTDPVTTMDPTLPIRHTFTQAGQYVVTLTVTNAFSLSSTETVLIRVLQAEPPTVRADAAPMTGPAPLTVTFSGDRTTDPNEGLNGLNYVWDFGDGDQAFESNVEHTYTQPGTYVATLTVTSDPFGESSSMEMTIRVTGVSADLPPTASLQASSQFGKAPLTVTFDGTASSDPERGELEYTWDFDDGSNLLVDGPTVTHTFNAVDTYYVSLTVTDEVGQTDSSVVAVVVTSDTTAGGQAPVARIAASTQQGSVPLNVTFDASDSSDPDGGALTYSWDFDDGTTPVEGQVVTHEFVEPGQYRVRLVVRDASGATGETTMNIVVTGQAAGDSEQDQPDGETDDLLPEVPAGCAPGCGPAGLMPVALTLLGIGGLRRWRGTYGA